MTFTILNNSKPSISNLLITNTIKGILLISAFTLSSVSIAQNSSIGSSSKVQVIKGKAEIKVPANVRLIKSCRQSIEQKFGFDANGLEYEGSRFQIWNPGQTLDRFDAESGNGYRFTCPTVDNPKGVLVVKINSDLSGQCTYYTCDASGNPLPSGESNGFSLPDSNEGTDGEAPPDMDKEVFFNCQEAIAETAATSPNWLNEGQKKTFTDSKGVEWEGSCSPSGELLFSATDPKTSTCNGYSCSNGSLVRKETTVAMNESFDCQKEIDKAIASNSKWLSSGSSQNFTASNGGVYKISCSPEGAYSANTSSPNSSTCSTYVCEDNKLKTVSSNANVTVVTAPITTKKLKFRNSTSYTIVFTFTIVDDNGPNFTTSRTVGRNSNTSIDFVSSYRSLRVNAKKRPNNRKNPALVLFNNTYTSVNQVPNQTRCFYGAKKVNYNKLCN